MIRKSTRTSRSTACHPWVSTTRPSRDRAHSRSMFDSSFRAARGGSVAMFKMKACLLYLLAGLVVAACTDLSTKVEDAIGEDVSGGSTPPISDPAAALTGVYNQLRTMRGVTNTFALMEHTTDEMMGPTRGTDWSDFGVWRQLHAHTWDPSHSQVLATWNDLNLGIFRATQV